MRLFELATYGRSSAEMGEFSKALTLVKGPIAGFDVGLRHIGMAMSDVNRQIAFSSAGFARGSVRQDIEFVQSIIQGAGVKAAVVGMPIAPRDKLARKLPDFIRMYSKTVLPECGIEVIGYWDESFSTLLAKSVTKHTLKGRLRKSYIMRKQKIDAVS